MKIIFVRHGFSQANSENRFAGHSDFELTEQGFIQAEKTAEFLDAYQIDCLYASDLKRAYHTGEAIAKRRGIKIITDERFREIFAGDWEGQLFTDLMQNYPDYQVWMKDIGNATCTNGESVCDLQKRVSQAVDEIVKKHPNQTVCVATHATPIRVMSCLWHGVGLEEMKNIPYVPNASVTVVEYDEQGVHILLNGEDSHLGELKTALPTNLC